MTAAAAWRDFLDLLAEAGETITGPSGATNERERAEGFRHLTRLVSIATEMIVEKGDPAYPAFTRWMNPHRKQMGDNPGTIYEAAYVDPGRHYRIVGNIGESTWVGLVLYGTGDDGSRRVAGSLDVTGDDHGDFDLHLAAVEPKDLPPGAIFVPVAADVTDILVRQYFHEPGVQAEATYSIEVVGADPAPPPPTEEVIAERLRKAGQYVRDLIEVEATISAISETTAPAEIGKPGASGPTGEVNWAVVNRVQPAPSIGYAGAWFSDLDDDEAIIVEGVMPPSIYASVQWLNRWMESGDYVHHQVALTDRELDIAPDGSFSVTLAHRDPGTGPWLDTTGIRNGTFVVRTLGSEPAPVTYRRVKLPE